MKIVKMSLVVGLFILVGMTKAFAVDFRYYSIASKPAGFKEGNEIKGYYADILARIGEELGDSSPEVTVAPYPRILSEMNNNSSGVALTILFPSSRFGDLVSQPSDVGFFPTAIISMKSSPVTWENINGMNIASLQGASQVYGAKFHDKVEAGDIKLSSMTTYDQALQMLKVGRIDGFAGNLGPMMSEIKAKGLDIAEPAIIANKVSRITVSVAPSTPNGDAIVSQIGDIVKGMLDSGEIQNIIESYLPDAKQPR